MNHASLFSGIGGFDLAAEWMGWSNLFHCEWNPFGQKVLNYYWPNAESYGDITKADFSKWRGQIDILTGGFPCQPYSLAGKRLGKEDERHLWPEMLRAIREIQPRWVVGENVLGLINWNDGVVFDEVQSDLEAQGYEVQPYVLPACSVNAPHRRDRIWIVAKNSNGFRCDSFQSKDDPEIWGQRKPCAGNNERVCTEAGATAQAASNRRERGGQRIERLCFQRNDTNTDCDKRFKRGVHPEGTTTTECDIGTLHSRENRGAWENFPTQSPICSRNDGISSGLVGITLSKHRTESLKAYGNAIVPQVVFQIFRSIELYEKDRG